MPGPGTGGDPPGTGGARPPGDDSPGDRRSPGGARGDGAGAGEASGPLDVGRSQLERLGRLIREQRRMAEMSLRELAARTNVSNPYLSQVERGLHEPSLRVLRSIAKALNVSAEALLVQAGFGDGGEAAERQPTVVAAIAADERLTDEQRAALLAVYRSYVGPAD